MHLIFVDRLDALGVLLGSLPFTLLPLLGQRFCKTFLAPCISSPELGLELLLSSGILLAQHPIPAGKLHQLAQFLLLFRDFLFIPAQSNTR